MFQHGLRVSDACGIKLYRVDTESSVLHVFGLGGIDDATPARRRIARNQCMAKRPRPSESGRQDVLCQRAENPFALVEG
jgi:site-specific recombinase XerD